MKIGGLKRVLLLITKSTLIVLLALIVPAVNYTVDPGGIFSSGDPDSIEMQSVRILAAGQTAENLVNYDERLVKRTCLYENGSLDTIVLGSSRAALITQEMAGVQRFFNYAVTGASIKDVIGMYGVYWQQGYTARRVILSIDPCFVNGAYDSFRFEEVLTDGYYTYLFDRLGYTDKEIGYNNSVNALYRRGSGEASFWDIPPNRQAELFSIPYFQSSISELLRGKERRTIIATDEVWTEYGALRSDGSYCYPRSVREYSEAQIRDEAATQIIEIAPDTARILGSEHVSADDPIRNLFAEFLQSLTEDGIQVDLVITPLNPVLYDYMLLHERYRPIIESEQWYYEMASKLSLGIIGSFDPHTLGAEMTDFYDGYHFRAEKVGELIEQLDDKVGSS